MSTGDVDIRFPHGERTSGMVLFSRAGTRYHTHSVRVPSLTARFEEGRAGSARDRNYLIAYLSAPTPRPRSAHALDERRSGLRHIFNMRTMRCCALVALASLEPTDAAFVGGVASARPRPRASASMVIGEQATSFGPAQAIRKLKEELPQFPFLAEGDGNPSAPCEPQNQPLSSCVACSFLCAANERCI